jgi:hypothetical protein
MIRRRLTLPSCFTLAMELRWLAAIISFRSAKRLELLRAVVPKPKLIGVLLNPKKPNFETQLSDVRDAAGRKGRELAARNQDSGTR